MPEKKQQLKQYLQKLLKADFKINTTSPLITKGNCKKVIGIAEYNGLGYDFIKELKKRFIEVHKTEYKSK